MDDKPTMIRKFILQLRTMRYLSLRQIYYYLLRRHGPPRYARITSAYTVRSLFRTKAPCAIKGVFVNETTFHFLNTEANLRLGKMAIDWTADTKSKLWKYNLHYFDYLRELERPTCNKDHLIDSWIKANPQGHGPGWDPFPTSLRIVNWIFYFKQNPTAEIPINWLESLYLQVLWLEQNDERHILANHYFENLKALFFAGCFFDSNDADRWRTRSLLEIPSQIHEQTLADGGHYERSHLYHCLMLENILDIYNISQSNRKLCNDEFVDAVETGAEMAIEWLAATLFPDQTIPLFNDSAFGISVPPSELFSYSNRLSLAVDFVVPRDTPIIDRPDTGLYGSRVGDDMFIIDCGEVGPSYQPGHTHCDFLSYELMISRSRIIVDTGVYEYEPGDLRDYVRSTRAHNTISVDGGEQSEIWGAFRVARRAQKIGATIGSKNGKIEFSGAYSGFYDAGKPIEHQRDVTVSLSRDGKRISKLVINDALRGSGHHTAENFIHFHPDIIAQAARGGEIRLNRKQKWIASIHLADNQTYRIESAMYCPEFGRKIPNQVLVLEALGRLPLYFSYEIELRSC